MELERVDFQNVMHELDRCCDAIELRSIGVGDMVQTAAKGTSKVPSSRGAHKGCNSCTGWGQQMVVSSSK